MWGSWIGGLIPILFLVRWNAVSSLYTDVMFICVTGFDSYGCDFGKFISDILPPLKGVGFSDL